MPPLALELTGLEGSFHGNSNRGLITQDLNNLEK
jgi:hypothetical protein